MPESMKSRSTRQKSLILNCLKENTHRHITADDVFELLKASNNPVGRATVYRYISHLEKEGLIKKYSFLQKNGACIRYIGEKSKCREHYHLVCDFCGKVSHVEDTPLQEAISAMQNKQHFVIDDTKTMFYGKCGECKNAKKDT